MYERKGYMKCSYKGCKKEAIFVLVDAYLFNNRINKKEYLVYPLCILHDAMFHIKFVKLKHN